MRALVTGCAGFIGSTLTDRLLAGGWEVVGVDSFEDYYPPELKRSNLAGALACPGFTLVQADLLDLATGDGPADGASRLKDLVGSVEHVYHLAAQPGVRGSWGRSFATYERNNVLVTQALLECAKNSEIAAFVYASSSSVYGEAVVLPMREDAECRPYSPYGVTKLAGEHLARLYARNFGVPAVATRLFTVYGPRQRPDMGFNRFIRAAMAGEPIDLYGDGGQTRDFTFVSDIVDGLMAAPAAAPGTVLNLGGGSRISVSGALDVLASVMGRDIDVRPAAKQAGDVTDTCASIERAGDLIGYAPKVDLAAGLAAEYRWLAESLEAPAV